jgi:cytoskeletal protein RodZ
MADIGPTLREARMRARIDISEVESATKIRAKYLRALENEEWDLLPGPTFVKSFLRTYGEFLGLDVTHLLEEYKRQHERPSDLDQLPISPHSTARARPPRPPRIPRIWFIAAGIVALLVLFAIIGSQGNDDGGGDDDKATTTTQSAQDAAAEKRRERKKEKAREKARREKRRREAARRVTRLKIVPTGEVFVCVVDASGKPLIANETLSPGSPSDEFRSKSFKIGLGNGAVTLRINGKDVETNGSSDPVAYSVAAGKAREIPAEDGPSCG